MTSFDTALKLASPRLSPPPTPLRSILIHGAVLTLWILAFAGSFIFHGIFAWSTGLVYVGYDTALLLFVAWQTLGLRGGARPTAASGNVPTLGVIIATYNEATVLPGTLSALFAQTDPPERIVIADDGSNDLTAVLLQDRYGLALPPLGGISPASPLHPSLYWLRLAHGGKAQALNAATSLIGTDTMITVDADTVLAAGATAAMRQAFATEPALVAATGVIIPICPKTLSGRVFQWFQTYEYIRNFLSRYAWMRIHSLLLISGAFAGFRRGAVIAVGGFDGDCLVEDYELIHRLRRHAVLHGLDWRTRVLNEATARTEAPATVAAFLRQRRRWFGGFLQTQYWYRDMVGDRRFGRLGTVMLPIKAVDTLQPLYGLTASALLIYYLLSGRFAVLIPAAGVMAGKIILDLAFHLWSVHLYRRWIGDRSLGRYSLAFLAAIVEPFSFQILRQCGAACGWAIFLTGNRSWGVQRRGGAVASAVSQPAPH